MAGLLPESAVYATTMASLATALVVLLRLRKRVAGLTLAGPWWWSAIALAVLAAVETCVALRPALAAAAVSEPLRFLAVMSLFAPAVSLLGAKRPQDRAWHFVVVSLWGMLALPAAEALFLQRGQALEMNSARGWFLLGLIAVAGLNLGLVRWWPSAVLLATAEVLMLAEYLPGMRATSLAAAAPSERIALGCLLLAAATVLVGAGWPRRAQAPPWDRLWLAFRDAFGALWGIRIAEQVNQAAARGDWAFRLRWGGFRDVATGKPLEVSPFEQQPALAQVMANLLRRFVDPRWTEAHLGRPLAETKQRPP